MNTRTQWLGALFFGVTCLLSTSQTKAECTWTVTGTVKVETQLSPLRKKYGEIIPLKGLRVKVSGATVGRIFDSWGDVYTDANGKFTVTKSKSCGDRKIRISVMFKNDDIEIRPADYKINPSNPSAGVTDSPKWYQIIYDTEKRRKPGFIQIVPTIFAAGKNLALNDSEARSHADIWVVANTLRDHIASYGSKSKFTKVSKLKYPNNDPLAGDGSESSYTNPITKVSHIFKSHDGLTDHLDVPTLFHEMMHIWAYEHSTAELDLATNLLVTGSTHCFNSKEHISFHEAFAEFARERLQEEIFGNIHTLPFNRDALNEGLLCSSTTNPDKINTMVLMEQHEYGWMSLFRMLTTRDLYQYTYAGEAKSTDFYPYHTGNESVFISLKKFWPASDCSTPTNLKLKDILDVFLEHPSLGFNQKLGKNEMNISDFMSRAAKILAFEPQKGALLNLLNPNKTSEPIDLLCQPKSPDIQPPIIRKPFEQER